MHALKNLFLLIAIESVSLLATSGAPSSPRAQQFSQMELISENKPRPLRKLFIFLDDVEKSSAEAIGIEFFEALNNKVAPILTSANVLHNYLKFCAEIDEQLKDPKKIQENPCLAIQQLVHNQLHLLRNTPESDRPKVLSELNAVIEKKGFALQLQKFLSGPFLDIYSEKLYPSLIADIRFQPSEWLIYRVDNTNSFYLLIPNSYISEIGPPQTFAYGLFLDEMKRVSADSMTHLIDFVDKNWAHAPREDYFIDLLPKLFMGRSAYAKEKRSDQIPEWTIYMIGHGTETKDVASIPVDQFHQILDFFEDKLLIKLFAYISCYSAGLNQEIIYTNDKSAGEQRTYSYPILTYAISDEAVARWCITYNYFYHGRSSFTNPLLTRDDIDWKEGELQLTQKNAFDQFFNDASAVPLNFKQLAVALGIDIESRTVKELQAAQVRLPGLPWFSLINAQNSIISIGKIMAATRPVDKPLNVMSFFQQQRSAKSKTGPIALLLYTNNIPFKIDMSTLPVQLPQIISMLPGVAIHHFSKIDASQNGLVDVLKHFRISEPVTKIFLIDVLYVAPSNPGHGKFMTVYNIILDGEYIFYTVQHKSYSLPADFSGPAVEIVKGSPEYQKYDGLFEFYYEMASEAEGEVHSLKQVSGQLRKIYEEREQKEKANIISVKSETVQESKKTKLISDIAK